MKHRKKLHLGILCLVVGLATALNAQNDDFFVLHTEKNTIKEQKRQQTFSRTTTAIPHYYRHHKKLPLTHTGVVIELTTSDLPLKRNYHLFKQFGNVYYDKLDKGGYAYCILTNFSDSKKARRYLEKIIIHRAPEAKVVNYHLGRRRK